MGRVMSRGRVFVLADITIKCVLQFLLVTMVDSLVLDIRDTV